MDSANLAQAIKVAGLQLGFDAIGITDTQIPEDATHLRRWLAAGRHGEMAWMARHGDKRTDPAKLIPGTVSVISARLNYWPQAKEPWSVIENDQLAYVSRYALGRDYHKVLRRRLQQLATQVESVVGEFGYRVFVDSGPVLEKAFARNAGLGWIGKHTNLIDRHSGSYFFIGELLTDLLLPNDTPASAHCGTCTRCIPACPTGAIVAPYELDARRCISYLTIEHPGSIPEALRAPIGNRIYGCDDCQLVCPWNKFAGITVEPDFAVRHSLDDVSLTALFSWDEATFLRNTEGSAIRRIGYERWSRNIAIALGNASANPAVVSALRARADDPSALVREHVRWALSQHAAKSS